MIRSTFIYSGLGTAAIILILFLASSLSSQAPFIVKWQEERLSVIAEKASLSDILQEVERQTGQKVSPSETVEEKISIQFYDLPLDEGVHKLMTSIHRAIPDKNFTNRGPSLLSASHSQPEVISTAPHIVSDKINTKDGLLQDTVLHAPDTNTRLESIQKLIENGDQQIIDILYTATKDSDPSIRELAYHQLYKLNAEQAADVLAQDSTSNNLDIRMTAIASAAGLLGADATEILKNATEDDDLSIKQMAFQQLVKIDGYSGLEVIRERLSHTDPQIRIMAIEAMASKGEEFADEAAQLALNDTDELVRGKALGLLQELAASKH